MIYDRYQEADNILVSVKENPGSPFFLTRVEGRVKAQPDEIKDLVRPIGTVSLLYIFGAG